ncbi:hypothetical protein LCGC14_2619280 [marine sediment metagenome]|uniref:Uncharacterized protein n=1 Tax=marine sediment metagenome TaxID=412755 RepID=A0A0F9A3S5_9ZZZZ
MTVRLSKTQMEVVNLMREGWELGVGCAFGDYRSWLQKGGIGKGGPTKHISGATTHALWKKKVIIISKDEFPTRIYKLVTHDPPD